MNTPKPITRDSPDAGDEVVLEVWLLLLDEVQGCVVNVTHPHTFFHMLQDTVVQGDQKLIVSLLLLERRFRGERVRGERRGGEGGRDGGEEKDRRGGEREGRRERREREGGRSGGERDQRGTGGMGGTAM